MRNLECRQVNALAEGQRSSSWQGGSVLVPQDPLSTVLSLTVQMINSIDAVTQDKVFRQGGDTIGICFIIAIAKILLLAM